MSKDFKLEPFDIYELKHMDKRCMPKKNTYNRDVVGVLEEFLKSDYDCCKVISCDTDRKAHIECTILRRSISQQGFTNSIRAVLRGECVYLVKKSKWEEMGNE